MDYGAFNKERRTSLIIKLGTRRRLQSIGRKGETYDQIINKLLDILNKNEK